MNAQIQSDEFAVVLLNEEGTIIDAHESCGEALGWNRAELQGKDVREVLQVGRDLVVGQLLQLQEEDASNNGNTSFSSRVLVRRKDESHFPARVTVRRFTQLGCWTAAFYRVNVDSDTDFIPTVRPEEIELASSTPVKKEEMAARKKSDPSTDMQQQQKPFRSVDLCLRKPLLPSVEVGEIAASSESSPPEPVSRRAEPTPEPPPIVIPEKNTEPMGDRAEKEREVPQTVPSSARVPAELEKERAERKRSEQRVASLSAQLQNLHRQLGENLEIERSSQSKIAEAEDALQKSEEELHRSRRSLEDEQNQRELADQQISALKELNSHLETDLSTLQTSNTELKDAHEELLSRLEFKVRAISESEYRLEKGAAERQRLESALAAAQRELAEEKEKSGIERAKLQLAVDSAELEHKRLEQEVLRSRLASINSARESGATLLDIREKAKQPIDELADTAGKLLQSEGTEEQKELAESLLKNILLVKTALDGAVPLPHTVADPEAETRAA